MVDCRGDSVHTCYSGPWPWSTAIAEENGWTDGLRHSTVFFLLQQYFALFSLSHTSMQPPTRWVYEWKDPHFYTMLVQKWETTSPWTGKIWQDYKAELLRVRGLNVMSIAEYQMASQMGVFPLYVELLLMCISNYCICMHNYDYGICMHAYYYCIYMHDCKLFFWCGLLHSYVHSSCQNFYLFHTGESI